MRSTPGGRQPGGGGVHVGVDERGGDQGAVEVDHPVHPVGVRVGGALAADPGHRVAVDEQRGGERVGRGVDGAPPVQGGAHGPILPRAVRAPVVSGRGQAPFDQGPHAGHRAQQAQRVRRRGRGRSRCR